jgi:hypothetical protein
MVVVSKFGVVNGMRTHCQSLPCAMFFVSH